MKSVEKALEIRRKTTRTPYSAPSSGPHKTEKKKKKKNDASIFASRAQRKGIGNPLVLEEAPYLSVCLGRLVEEAKLSKEVARSLWLDGVFEAYLRKA